MDLIRVDIDRGDVARMTLARPERRNAINTQMADEVVTAIEQLVNADVRVGVIDAVGPVFCAGADLADLEDSARAVDRIVEILLSAPVHWTAEVRYPVYGAGLALLATCPTVLATPTSTFTLPELARGFFPLPLLPAQVSRLGARAAFGMAFSATPIGAAEADRIGLVSAVVDDAEMDGVVAAQTAALAERDGLALIEGVRLWQALANTTS